MGWRITRGLAGVAALMLASCTAAQPDRVALSGPVPPTSIETVGVISKSLPLPRGYLDPAQVPDSDALVPPPPAAGTAAKAADQEAFEAALTVSDARQALAASDADLNWPNVVLSFEPLVGTSLSDGGKPHVEMLLRRAMTDAGLATYSAKNHYKRVRPFVENDSDTCTPGDEEVLRSDGSYPSGHTAIGWMLALVLTELFPEREDAVLARGYDFGVSRIVCRVHWDSDTRAGRVVAAATYARLHADPTFLAQLELAREELEQR